MEGKRPADLIREGSFHWMYVDPGRLPVVAGGGG